MALVNDKLRKLRDSHNLKSNQLFKLIGYEKVDPSDISEFFNGSKGRNLKENYLDAFALYFNVDLQWYLLNDDCPVIDNPQEKYPYGYEKIKEMKQNELLEDLKIKVSNYKEIDEEFKKDTINMIAELTKVYKGYDNIFKNYEDTVKASSLDFLKNIGKYCNTQNYSSMFKKIFNTLNLIIEYFNENKAVSFYQATSALFNIKHELAKIKDHLKLIDDINSRIIKITQYSEKLTTLDDSSIALLNNLVDSLDVCDNPKVREVINKYPVLDTLSLINIYVVTLHNQLLNITFSMEGGSEDYEVIYNKLNNFRLSQVYDEEVFLLESNPDTLEKLYRFLIECYNDELVIKFIDNEYHKIKKEYEEWVKLATTYLK